MKINYLRFEENSYSTAIKNTTSYDSESKIFNLAKANPQFHYSSLMDYTTFKSYYDAKECQGRKIWVIPKALQHGIIETISGLSIGIIIGIPFFFIYSLAKQENHAVPYCKFIAFRTVRHIQISVGYLTTLLNEQRGLYHIQEGKFYLKIYQCWLNKNSYLRTNESMIFNESSAVS